MNATTPVTAVAADEPARCPNPKCRRPVIEAQVIGRTGAPKPVTLDPEQVSWADNGRYRRVLHVRVGLAARMPVTRLVSPGAGFGSTSLYRDHKLTCRGGTGVRLKSREHG
jgi:hypothetical protein